jgi:hypothetical protein
VRAVGRHQREFCTGKRTSKPIFFDAVDTRFCARDEAAETASLKFSWPFAQKRVQIGNPATSRTSLATKSLQAGSLLNIQAADNRLVVGSSPPISTTQSYANGDFPCSVRIARNRRAFVHPLLSLQSADWMLLEEGHVRFGSKADIAP